MYFRFYIKFKQFLKKQCGESEKSTCRAKLCRLESKAGFSQSFELAHYSAAQSNFLKSFFPTSFTISSVSDLFSPLTLRLVFSRVLFGRTDDDQLSPLFVTNVICAKVRNGYWPLENFQTKELPLNVFSRVLGSCPALEKNDGDEDMSLGGEGDLTPKQLVKLLMMLAFRAHLRWHLMVIAAKNLNRKMSSVTCRFIILQRIGIFAG